MATFFQRDNKIAQLLFDVVVQGVVDNADTLMTRGEKDTWLQQLNDSINSIVSNSYMYYPDVLRAVLHLVINNDILVSPEALATGKWQLYVIVFFHSICFSISFFLFSFDVSFLYNPIICFSYWSAHEL